MNLDPPRLDTVRIERSRLRAYLADVQHGVVRNDRRWIVDAAGFRIILKRHKFLGNGAIGKLGHEIERVKDA